MPGLLHRLLIFSVALAFACLSSFAGSSSPATGSLDFESRIKPLLSEHCYDCHGDGMNKGSVSLDEFKSTEEALAATDLWARVLKNVRAGLMPPEKKERLTSEEMNTLETFIKRTAFKSDPEHPDPGRVTIRRLNRVEYKNTIRELMGIEFNVDEEFPPDDTGYGFDNIGDVLTISPMLLEKYLQAAEKIVSEAVPTVARYVQERSIPGKQFSRKDEVNAEQLSFYKEAFLTNTTKVSKAGDYKVTLDFSVRGAFNFDPGRATIVFKIDDEEKLRQEFKWENGKKFEFDYDVNWKAGEHTFVVELQPLNRPEEKKTSIDLRLNAVRIRGPLDPKDWVKSKNYDRFFFKEEVPADPDARREYAHEILARFCKKAFRRQVDPQIVERLTTIAETGYTKAGKNFEQSVAQAMTAVLATPRFLFRVEETLDPTAKWADIDEYALASRLSYFLWSSMPDNELFELAERGDLRKNLRKQVERMLKDDRSRQFIDNFTGQWLQVRDVSGIAVNERAIFARENTEERKPGERRRFGPPKVELDGELRRAMQEETHAYFSYVVQEDRSVLELLDSDYTFLNAKLAKVYGIPGVEGREIRKVTVPADSPRGGMLTHGSLLLVTSNPTRTSPVKRGLFLLDNFLGTPPPPPPPDIPSLEESEKQVEGRRPTLRETLEIHREKPLCASCHNRMDPLGLALENFNALGLWREQERGQKIDAAGRLITGESFTDIRELKKILATKRHVDFYRCLTEKLLTYALGRGLDYYDVETVDRIVDKLEADNGRFSTLLLGVIESAPFQQRRNVSVTTASIQKDKTVALEK